MGRKRITKEEFIRLSNNVHKNKYNYDKLQYEKIHSKGIITCPIHGDFEQNLSNHLRGSGCPKCGTINTRNKQSSTVENFIKKARKIHGDKYDYSKVEYFNTHTKVCIICPIHGEFWQTPHDHLVGYGCRKCANQLLSSSQKMTIEEFLKKARKIHEDKYDYSKVEYNGYDTKICIICPIHGEFWQTPHMHLQGHGCSICAGENNILEDKLFLDLAKNLNEEILKYKKFKWLKNKLPLSLDIYIPSKKIAIEYQGIQHFKPIGIFGGNEAFEKQIKNDEIKINKCKENGIKLLHFTYNSNDCKNWNKYKVYTNINDLITEINGNFQG